MYHPQRGADRRAVRDRRLRIERRAEERRRLVERRRLLDRRMTAEPATEHLRNALQFLHALEDRGHLDAEDHADLDAALRRLSLALTQMERRISPPGMPPLP